MGQEVIVNAVAESQYADNDEKRWIVKRIKERTGWYVGHTYKREGTAVPEDYSSPIFAHASYLKISRTVKLARVKFSTNSNDVFVFPENIKPVYGGN